MDTSDLCLHPYRKRKFFYGLAELFNEQPPAIERIGEVFPSAPPESLTDAAGHAAIKNSESRHVHQEQEVSHAHIEYAGDSVSPSQEPEEDSFEYVDLGKPRMSLDSSASLRSGFPSQNSFHDSMQDSMHFLPPELKHDASLQLSGTETRGLSDESDHRHSQPTILSLSTSDQQADELIDYYDLDRYCEPIPCWAYENQARCALHTEAIRRPMLLFCLQALDEFIASVSILRGSDFLVESCRLARTIFASMWDQDIRSMSCDHDFVISDYVSQKVSLPGVAVDVWRVIDAYWLKHKQNFLHQQELYFIESRPGAGSVELDQWCRIRHLLQIYGLRPRQAKRLDAEGRAYTTNLSDRQLDLISHGFQSSLPVQFGLEYARRAAAEAELSTLQHAPRDLLSQNELKIAFQAIEIHLRKWSRDVQVFPCGSFSRGAAFGSVVDIVVALPEQPSEVAPVDIVLKVLARANVVQLASVSRLSANRVLSMVPYKAKQVVLDMKVYRRPQSWFALLYYTGPESFTRSYFSQLLKRSLGELSVPDFDHIYALVVEQLGLEVVASVDSEPHLFDLIHREYLITSQRI